MELCCRPRAILSLPRLRLSPIIRHHPSLSSSKTLSFHSKPGWHLPLATASEETSTIVSQKFDEPSEPKKAPVTIVEAPNGGEQGEAGDFLSKLDVKRRELIGTVGVTSVAKRPCMMRITKNGGVLEHD